MRGDAAAVVRRALALRADEAVDVVDLTSRALGDGDEEAARRRNAADAERLAGAGLDDDETDDAEDAKQPESPTTIKEDDDGNDVELWWWPQAWAGGAPELNLLVWERAILVEITASMAALATSLAQSAGQDAILYAGAATTVGLILTSLLLPITLLQATKYIDGTWTLAVTRADAAGVALADALCARSAIGERPVTLVGYPLGARVVFSCLEELARRHARAQKRCRRREQRRARAASVVGVGAHAGGADPSSDVGVLSDEEDVDDDERLHGTLTVAPLDGVHWVDAAGGRRLRLAVRAGAGCGYTVGSNAKVSSRARRLFGSASDNDEPDALLAGTRDLRAAPGEPLAWSGPDNRPRPSRSTARRRRRGRHRARGVLVELRDDGVARGTGGEPLPRAGAGKPRHAIDATSHATQSWARKQAARDDPSKPVIRLAALSAPLACGSGSERRPCHAVDATAPARRSPRRRASRSVGRTPRRTKRWIVIATRSAASSSRRTSARRCAARAARPRRRRAASGVVAGRLVNCYCRTT